MQTNLTSKLRQEMINHFFKKIAIKQLAFTIQLHSTLQSHSFKKTEIGSKGIHKASLRPQKSNYTMMPNPTFRNATKVSKDLS